MWRELPSYWWSELGAVELFILGMGTWRLTSLIVNEDGPFYIFERFRHFIGVRYTETNEPFGTNVIAEGLSCIWCASVWFGFLTLLFYVLNPLITLIVYTGLTLSTLAIVVEEVLDR